MAGTLPLATARLLIVPGLRNSSPLHWQSWLQSLHSGSVRVNQADWTKPDLETWAANITDTLAAAGRGPWLGVAHSFGCLALARHLALEADSPLAAALLVAPADADAFGLAGLLPQTELPYAQRWLDAMREPPERAHHFHTASLAEGPFAV